MKIGIDARICDEEGYYAQYISELIDNFCQQNTEHSIVVYRKKNLSLSRYSPIDDIQTKKRFEKQNFALMIFFDHHIPYGYKGDFIVFIENLKEVFFPKKKWLARKIYRYKLQKAIEKAKKVLVMDTGTALELNEQLNISEDAIEKIPGFFPKYTIPENRTLQNIDIKTKHNLRWDYLIYDSGNELHNNFERILKTLKNLKESGIILYLIILCEDTNKDLEIRQKTLEYDIAQQITFLGPIANELEKAYYTQSSGVIFSSIYESFPFQFTKAIAYNCQIFANDIPANKDIMGESISYLDPLSVHNMTDTISERLKKNKNIDYSNVFKKYNARISAQELTNYTFRKN